jgi:hypothetical protein
MNSGVLKESSFKEIQPLRWGSFTPAQRDKIASKGAGVIDKWKSSDTQEYMNRLLKIKGSPLRIQMPGEEYVIKNLDDITWVLDGPGVEVRQFDKKRSLLRKERQSLIDGTLILFMEDDKLSEFNLFNTNIKNWIHLITEYLKDEPTFLQKVLERGNIDDKDLIIDIFFEPGSVSGKRSFAVDAMFYSIIKKIEETRVRLKSTWSAGTEVEERYIKYITELKGTENVKSFMDEGGIVDQKTGVDLCLYHKERWIPFQIKNTASEAQKSIPIDGVSVYPSGDGWKYFKNEGRKSF